MVLTETEPQGSLRDFEYYTFNCPACGDTERRLLPRGKVPITKILRATTTVQAPAPAPLRKPYETIPKKEDHGLARHRSSGPARPHASDTKADSDRINDLLKNPRKFIDAFVRSPRPCKSD